MLNVLIDKFFQEEYTDLFFITLFVLFLPVISIPLVLYKMIDETNIKKQGVYLLFFSLIMGYLALHTVPLNTDDLSRHYENMTILKNTPFLKIFNASYTAVYLNTFIMYLCSKIGIYGLYPAIYIFIGYFLVFFNIIRLRKEFDIAKSELFVMILFVLFAINCRDFISGLRNYFAFIIVSFCITSRYLFGLNKRLSYLFIAVAGLIHTSAFVFFAWLIISDLKLNKKIKRLIQICTLFVLPISIISYNVLVFFIPILKNSAFLTKIYSYVTTPNIININVYIFYLGILVLSVICHFINKKQKKLKYKEINHFLDYYLVFLVAVSPIMLMLTRFIYFLIAFIPVIFYQTFDNIKNNKKLRFVFICVLLLFVFAGGLMLKASMGAYPWQFDKNIFFILI